MTKDNDPEDYCIDLDTEYAKSIGFTSDKFDGWLWHSPSRITISFIISKEPGKGNLSRLFDAILEQGLAVAVPTPSDKMRAILERKGFTKGYEPAPEYGEEEMAEMWTLHPKRAK